MICDCVKIVLKLYHKTWYFQEAGDAETKMMHSTLLPAPLNWGLICLFHMLFLYQAFETQQQQAKTKRLSRIQ